MKVNHFEDVATTLTADNKGILAMDESTPTCNKRFEKYGISSTEQSRRDYRELLITTPNLSQYISGVILYDETIRQKTKAGIPMIQAIKEAGLIPGIKVDGGAKPFAGSGSEKYTEGLDGLRERLKEYKKMGARFAKWRAVFSVGENIPSQRCIEANAVALSYYSALCQEAGLVPIVEPEVLMNGNHSINRCAEVTQEVLGQVFNHLHLQKVNLEGIILKPNMVLPGKSCPQQSSAEEVAQATIHCLLQSVPASVPGIAFLSGGQSPQSASLHLSAMHKEQYKNQVPWDLSFSYSRALQEPVLKIWNGNQGNTASAQQALIERAQGNSVARQGRYQELSEVS